MTGSQTRKRQCVSIKRKGKRRNEVLEVIKRRTSFVVTTTIKLLSV